jgi:hypothetical protein
MRNLSTHVRTDPSCVFSCVLIKILALGIHWETRVRRVDGSVSAAEKQKNALLQRPWIANNKVVVAAGPAFTPAAARQNARAKNRKKGKDPSHPSHSSLTLCVCVLLTTTKCEKIFPFLSSRIFS